MQNFEEKILRLDSVVRKNNKIRVPPTKMVGSLASGLLRNVTSDITNFIHLK